MKVAGLFEFDRPFNDHQTMLANKQTNKQSDKQKVAIAR